MPNTKGDVTDPNMSHNPDVEDAENIEHLFPEPNNSNRGAKFKAAKGSIAKRVY